MPAVLALDLGTTTATGLCVNGHGAVTAAVSQEHEADVAGLPAGHAEQSPRQWLAVVQDVLRQLAEQSDETPHCIAITGQMHGILFTDRDRRPLTNLITWQDRRALARSAGSACNYVDAFLAECRAEDLARTGCRLAPGYGAVTLFTLQEQGLTPADTNCISSLGDWMAAELTDETTVSDRTLAASLGVYDLQNDCWSDPLIQAGGLPDLFPEVIESGRPIGGLRSEMAEATGLPAGLPVCGAIGDNQASVLGSMPPDESTVQLTVGTGGQINWAVPEFCRVSGLDTRYLPDGRFLLVGAGHVGGDAFSWVKNATAAWLSAFGCERSSDEIYARLAELAEAVPEGSDGLTVAPYFRGTRREPELRGTISRVEWHNFTPGHLARAVLEGMAEGLHSFLDLAGDRRPSFDSIIGTGNGLRKNPLLVRCIERRFGCPLRFPAATEPAAFGAALLAGANTGLWPDLQTATGLIKFSTGQSDSC